MAAEAANREQGAGGKEQEGVSEEQGAGSREQEEGTVAVVENVIPAGPTPEEEAAMLTPDRTSEQFYSQPPPAENGDTEPATAASLPPMEDLVKRIPVPTRELLEELFRARFVTVKRVPRAALKD